MRLSFTILLLSLLAGPIYGQSAPGDSLLHRIIHIPPIGPEKMLRYDTGPVIYHIPYTHELLEWMREPGQYTLPASNGSKLWSVYQTPAYMAEWVAIEREFQRANRVDLAGRPQISRLMYVLLYRMIEQGNVGIYDNEEKKWVREIWVEEMIAPYHCACAEGDVRDLSYFIHDGERLIYAWKAGEVPDCCANGGSERHGHADEMNEMKYSD